MSPEKPDVQFEVLNAKGKNPNKLSVLVADDEPFLQSLVYDTISDDFQVLFANNGREAIEQAEKNKPDLVLMDLLMPDIGGLEAVQFLLKNETTKSIPIIVISAAELDMETKEKIKKNPNVKGFLTKPFRPKKLRETIEKIITKNHEQR